MKNMGKAKIAILVGIVALIIAGIILNVNFNKKENIFLLKGQVFRYFECEISQEVKENKIEYTININPRYEEMKYENVKIVFNVSGVINSTINDRTTMLPVRFKTEEINLNEDGKYTGTFIYEEEGVIYNTYDRNRLNLSVKSVEGTILK